MKTLLSILFVALAAIFNPSTLRAVRRRFAGQHFANEAAPAEQDFLTFANQLAPDEKGWVQLSPYGDFPNVDKNGREVIQRFAKADAEAIVNEFKSLANLPQRLLGLPWYVGHPDHPRFKGQPGHTDTGAKGRIKGLEAREDGLYANVKFNAAGRDLVEGEVFHGHSVNWHAVPAGSENGKAIFRPGGLKSVGFTNQPQIPVRPASLANEDASAGPAVPPKLKVLAGFKEDEDVTMEQIIAALEQAHPIANEKAVHHFVFKLGEQQFDAAFANAEAADALKAFWDSIPTAEAAKKGAETALANEKSEREKLSTLNSQLSTDFANERKARASLVVEPLVKAGKVILADKDAKIAELCNAADFDSLAQTFANAATVVKTVAKTGDIAKHRVGQVQGGERVATAGFQTLIEKREQEFPNEEFSERFAAVANSPEGAQLFTQFKRAGAQEE